jgi:hypothetical protein
MATGYVLIPFIDADGEHQVNEKFEYATDTDEAELSWQTLLNYGIITTVEPKSETPAE